MAQGETPEGVPVPGPEEGQTPDQPRSSDEPRPDEELPDLDKLLERYDPEALRKNQRVMGIAGGLADRLASQRAEQLAAQKADAIVQQRLEAAERERTRRARLEAARKGDFYALGEQSARDLLQEDQQGYVERYRQRAVTDAYGSVQRTIDEIAAGFPPEVVALAAERMGEIPADARWEQGLKQWLPALIEAQAEFKAQQPEAQKKLEQKIGPALRARIIAEMNGTEPVADSGSGRAQGQRTITDEQIADMEPEQWLQVYDIKAGKFKPGVVYKPTRALDPRALQMTGRGA